MSQPTRRRQRGFLLNPYRYGGGGMGGGGSGLSAVAQLALNPRGRAGRGATGSSFVATAGLALGAGPPATFDPAAKGANATLSNGNRTLTDVASGSYGTASTTVPQSAGLLYCEFVMDTIMGGGDRACVGFTTSAGRTPTQVGDASTGWGYMVVRGGYYHSASVNDLGHSGAQGDIVMMALNLTTGNAWWGRNGAWNQGNPAAGTSPIVTGVAGTIYPAAMITMFLPPMPIPSKAKGDIVVVFDIDSTGKVIDFEFTPTKDAGYNRKLRDTFAGFQFRPAVNGQGVPVRSKYSATLSTGR